MAEDYRHRNIDRSTVSSSYESTYDEMKRDFESLDYVSINNACTAWASVASTLGDAANNIRALFADPLAGAWESESAADAQQQLRTAQATASALAQQCMTMARATDYAANYAQWYKENFPRDVGPSGVGAQGTQNAADHTGNYLTRLNEVTAYTLPPEVAARYVTANSQSDMDDFAIGPGGPGSVSPPGAIDTGGLGTPASATAGDTGVPPFGDVSGPGAGPGGLATTGPGDPSLGDFDPGTATAGAGGLGGGAGLGAGLAGGAGVAGGGGGLGAGVGAGLGAGLGAGAAAGLGAGARGGSGAGPRAGGGRGGGLGAGKGADPGSRAAAAPGHGGGPNADDETEQERTTWLTEDEDVWGGDSTAPPSVIDG